MKTEFFAPCFEAIEANLYIGFSEAKGGEHYFILARDEESEEEAVPNRKNIYAELDDGDWAEDVGVDWVTLSRDRFTVRFGSDTRILAEYDEVAITFSLEGADFERLRQVLHKIMRGYEDRLNLID
ncbi:MAG: hypothetical protein EAZ98_00745 [Oscillatoriales cyanobacterium]|uniref:Uncharacterized protein n=1 Tax=Microcoleus anatoxicus PTRS2 TaxID=2705321 RepID=A0ABU8YXK7_9CYAN|nr:MAG: hypothetical protein EAZ98_00745 [Oscillatoriales cyanobacterium]